MAGILGYLHPLRRNPFTWKVKLYKIQIRSIGDKPDALAKLGVFAKQQCSCPRSRFGLVYYLNYAACSTLSTHDCSYSTRAACND